MLTRIVRRLPAGALLACFIVLLTHLGVSRLIVPHPIAREPLRRKVIALTEFDRPSLIAAGDSRAQVHIRPGIVAQELGWPEEQVINAGLFLSEPSAVLAAYREFAHRFPPAPIILISVSFYSVNDGITDARYINDEVLWSVGVLDRFRLVPPGRALMATFLPEKACWRLLTDKAFDRARPVPHRGFLGKPASGSEGFSPEVVARQGIELKRCWFAKPRIQGIRWRQFQADLRSLRDGGVQVVILDSPVHPAFADSLADPALKEAHTRFHRQLAELCGQMKVPILQYTCDSFSGYHPDDLFFNLTHLNRRGATLLSEKVGRDLHGLLAQARLHAPDRRLASTRPVRSAPSAAIDDDDADTCIRVGAVKVDALIERCLEKEDSP